MTIPVNAALGLIAWRMWRVDVISTPLFIAVLVAVMALLVVQEVTVFKVNRPAMANSYAPEDQYPFRSVAVLSIAYFATFGSELAVVSMLPGFFEETWGLGPSAAGIAASGFAFVNLAARPAGGIMSDRLGSRRHTLTLITIGLLVGYVLLSTMGAAWPWALAVVACMVCSFFVQRRRRRVRRRPAREEAGQRPDRRHGRGVREHRRGGLPDGRTVRQHAGVLPHDRGCGGRGPDRQPVPRRASRELRHRTADRSRRRRHGADQRYIPPRSVHSRRVAPFPPPSLRRQRAPRDDRTTLTHCPYCALNCGIGLGVANDAITGLVRWKGSPLTGGAVCSKGSTAWEQVHHPDRLVKPLVRRDGVLMETGWEEALDIAAGGFLQIRERHGADANAVLSGGSLTKQKAYLMGKFARLALGTRHIDYNGRFCMVSAGSANMMAFGMDRAMTPLDELVDADVIVVVGADLSDAYPVMLPTTINKARQRGARVVAIDPRFGRWVQDDDLQIAIRPGTEVHCSPACSPRSRRRV